LPPLDNIIYIYIDNKGESLYIRFMNKIQHLPESSRFFIKNKSVLRKKIINKIEESFKKWSFFSIESPVIDYYDNYYDILTPQQKRDSYKFTDRNGDLIVLRNDLTLFTARLVATRSIMEESVYKYYYSDYILKGQAGADSHELYQIGCEIVGDNFSFEEVELLIIAFETIKELKIKEYSFHIGDITILEYFKNKFNLDDDTFTRIRNYFKNKDREGLVNLLNITASTEVLSKDLIILFDFCGTYDELKSLLISQETRNILSGFFNLADNLNKLGYSDSLIYDFCELPSHDYYSGIYFNLYCSGIQVPLLTGGRYDKLFGKFGRDKSAVGFTFWLDPLEIIIDLSSLVSDLNSNEICQINDISDFTEIIDKVRKGGIVDVRYK